MERNPWWGVEMRHLAALAAIDQTGSFHGAADELGYVQSAISQQIARLEDVVGARLIERTRGRAPISLTAAGMTLRGHVDPILAHLTAARADLERAMSGGLTTVRVGLLESMAIRVLPRMLAVLATREPELDVVAQASASWEEMRTLVAEGELDLAFDYLPLDQGPFDQIELLRSPLMLLVHADSPLARRAAAPTLDEIARLPLVEHSGWRFTPRLRKILEVVNDKPRFVQGSTLNRAVQAMVGAGLGAAVMPRVAIDLDDEDTVAVDLSGVLPPARVALFWHRERTQSQLQGLIRLAQEICAEIQSADELAEASPIAA
jgi:DNA-binding transcriptional LysR family regulator